jgi:hypothetical protein
MIDNVQESEQYKAAQERKKSIDDSVKHILNMREAKGLVDFLMSIATRPSYVPGRQLDDKDTAFFEGERHLAMNLLLKAKLFGEQ